MTTSPTIMEFTQETQKYQAPQAGLNISRIPSPMHSSSRMQPVLQLPDQIFNPQMLPTANAQYPNGVTWTEDRRCSTPSDAMMECGTSSLPTNVATTHWRTMVCPSAPKARVKRQAPVLQRFGSFSMDAGTSSISSLAGTPANHHQRRPSLTFDLPTPTHRSLAFDSMPSLPAGSMTPSGIGLNTAFIASTPTHNDGDVTMFGRMRSLSSMSLGSDTTPVASGAPPMIPQQPQRFSRLLSRRFSWGEEYI